MEELREELRSRSLPAAGRKAELVARLEEADGEAPKGKEAAPKEPKKKEEEASGGRKRKQKESEEETDDDDDEEEEEDKPKNKKPKKAAPKAKGGAVRLLPSFPRIQLPLALTRVCTYACVRMRGCHRHSCGLRTRTATGRLRSPMMTRTRMIRSSRENALLILIC